jgi:hypothetical protein
MFNLCAKGTVFSSDVIATTACLPLQNYIEQRCAVPNEPEAVTAVRFEWYASCMQLLRAAASCSL